MARRPSLQLDQITPVGDNGRPVLPLNTQVVLARPESPVVVSEGTMESAVASPNQRLALRLRYQHQWSREVIAQIMGKTPKQVASLLEEGLLNLQKRVNPDVRSETLVIGTKVL